MVPNLFGIIQNYRQPPLPAMPLVCPASAGTVRTVSLGNQLLTIQFTLSFNPLRGPHRKQEKNILLVTVLDAFTAVSVADVKIELEYRHSGH